MSTWNAPALNTPELVASYTATGHAIAQLTVDFSTLAGGAVLNIKMADTVTGSLLNFINEDRGYEAEAGKGYVVILGPGDVLNVTFEQKAGPLAAVKYGLRVMAEP